MSTTTTARIFLGLNTGFSILCSLTLLLLPDFFSELMFHAPANWVPFFLQLLAGGLLLFALSLVLLVANPYVSRGEVMLIVALDVVWIAASAALIVFAYEQLTVSGIAIIEAVAIFVGIFALGQFLGARKIQPPLSKATVTTQGGFFKASVRRAVAAPPATVWQVMNDHPGYADVAENLTKVEVVSGEGKGMLRRCYGIKGEHWTETCDTFEDGKSYGFKVHTDAPDYPYPFENLKGHWSVTPLESGAEFAIDITARPKGNFLSRALFTTLMRLKSKTLLIDLADAWSDRMEHEART